MVFEKKVMDIYSLQNVRFVTIHTLCITNSYTLHNKFIHFAYKVCLSERERVPLSREREIHNKTTILFHRHQHIMSIVHTSCRSIVHLSVKQRTNTQRTKMKRYVYHAASHPIISIAYLLHIYLSSIDIPTIIAKTKSAPARDVQQIIIIIGILDTTTSSSIQRIYSK